MAVFVGGLQVRQVWHRKFVISYYGAGTAGSSWWAMSCREGIQTRCADAPTLVQSTARVESGDKSGPVVAKDADFSALCLNHPAD